MRDKVKKILALCTMVVLISCARETEVPEAAVPPPQSPTGAPSDTMAPPPAAYSTDTTATALPTAEGARRISLREAVTLLERGRAVLVDVRSAESYQTAHAAGAIHIPEAEMVNRLADLPIGKMVITYCT